MKRTVTTLPYTELEVADGNFDTSRATIDRVVIHTMVGTWQGAASRFDTYGTQVSAHYGVKLDGGIIHWLEEFNTAYHAGSYSMNQRSIGIEHEDGGDYNGVRPDALYKTSAKLVRDICDFYDIPLDRDHIIKHSQVIATGCPDALDIDRIVREAQAVNIPAADPLKECLRQHDDLVSKCNTKDQQIADLQKQLNDLKNKSVTVDPQVPADQQSSTSTASPAPVLTNTVITGPNFDAPTTNISAPVGFTDRFYTFLNWLLGK